MTVDGLLDETSVFLKDLEETQRRFIVLLKEKRKLLTAARTDALQPLSERELELSNHLQSLLNVRRCILQKAKLLQFPSNSIRSLVETVGGKQRAALLGRLQRAEETAAGLRYENLIQWIISQRAYNHLSEMLELIANCGKKAPTYSRNPDWRTTGGAVLDTSI